MSFPTLAGWCIAHGQSSRARAAGFSLVHHTMSWAARIPNRACGPDLGRGPRPRSLSLCAAGSPKATNSEVWGGTTNSGSEHRGRAREDPVSWTSRISSCIAVGPMRQTHPSISTTPDILQPTLWVESLVPLWVALLARQESWRPNESPGSRPPPSTPGTGSWQEGRTVNLANSSGHPCSCALSRATDNRCGLPTVADQCGHSSFGH
jgi:hypothetical protein